jgi:hypothetical protein
MYCHDPDDNTKELRLVLRELGLAVFERHLKTIGSRWQVMKLAYLIEFLLDIAREFKAVLERVVLEKDRANLNRVKLDYHKL